MSTQKIVPEKEKHMHKLHSIMLPANMISLIIVFGLPASGKTYVGKILQKSYGFFFYDGDNDLTGEMEQAISQKRIFTDNMRDVFFEKLIQSIKKLQNHHTRLAVAQTFIKEHYRTLFLKHFPHAQFILIKTGKAIRESRLAKRKEYALDAQYVQKMSRIFEPPRIPYSTLLNNAEGEQKIKAQLDAVFFR